jgi:ABC-type polysaccharide/polyol phosphate transport system ATPase subunit
VSDPVTGPRSAEPPYAIDAQGLGVRYNLRLTRQTTVRTSFRNLLSRGDGPTHFWALRDVSFRVVHGESLAVIGPNGAGKSTLLQVLAGIIQPNEGEVDVIGHVSSLLTLGAGFDQDLTGRDNIRLAGAFLGMPHRQMEGLLPGIVEYADMGDAVFRAKSKERIKELTKAAKGIVIVTHDMNWVTEFCNRAMLLDHGRVILEGDPAEVVRVHEERSEKAKIDREADLARKLAAATGTQPTHAG